MQTCYNCGRQVPDETLICPDCGALVRRYTTPARPEVQAVPVSEAAPGQVPAQNALRLQGGVRVWLIIQCVISAYMAFSSLCTAILAANPQVFDAMLSEPGMEAFAEMFTAMRELLPEMLGLFIILCVLFTAKLFCHLWLLIRPRRLAFYVSIGVSFAGMLAAFFFGGSVMVIVYFMDPLLTWLGLRRYWLQMRQ